MHADPARALRRALDFIGAPPIDDGIIRNAVEYATFGNMRKLEREGALWTRKLRPGLPDDEESYKVRRGRVGGYIDYLSPDDLEYMEDVLEAVGCPFYPRMDSHHARGR